MSLTPANGGMYDSVSGTTIPFVGTVGTLIDESPTIISASLKTNNTWRDLIGSNIEDVNLGGGGIQTYTNAQWIALSTAEKQSHGLVAVTTADTGYVRGRLLYGASYAPTLLVASNNESIILEADCTQYTAGESTWNGTVGTVQMPIPSAKDDDGSVIVASMASSAAAYFDLGSADTPFTAYIVAKRINGGTYGRILAATYAHASASAIMLYGDPVVVSQWIGDTNTHIPSSNYFVAAITFGSASGGIVATAAASSSFVEKTPAHCGQYLTIGRTDASANTGNAEPATVNVKYLAVTNVNESPETIAMNVSALINHFLQ